MAHPVSGIDHSYLLVHDLDASAALYRRLGFTLSPRGLHSAEKGTGNHTIIFRDDYLELLGIVSDTEGNRLQRELLAEQGEGVQAIANRTAGADAAAGALAARGIATGPVSAFSRPLPLPGGSEGRASFRTLPFAPSEVPLGHFFLCQHETPDLVWRPELRDHANGAVALDAIIGVVANPLSVAQTYARFYAAGRVSKEAQGYRVDTGENSAMLLFADTLAAAAMFPGQDIAATPSRGYAGLRIRVIDIEKTRRALAAGGVPAQDSARGGLIVAPARTSGAILEFVPV